MAVWGIMGGSFDPIHTGHIQMAESVKRELNLDGVVFIPVGDPPHKSSLAPARQRYRMVELAIADIQGFIASDIEVNRRSITYTVDTLRELHERQPGDEFIYIVGADTLMVIETWHDFAAVPAMLKAVASVPRFGTDEAAIRSQAEHLLLECGLQVIIIHEPGPDISSTGVRMAVARGQAIGNMVPKSVAEYIYSNKLYRDKMLDKLKTELTADRYRHTLGVEHTAMMLARKNGFDEEKARVAGLLHDCAKCMPEKDMLKLLKLHGAEPKFASDRTRTLMHAAAGAIVAAEQYGVTDTGILSAIRWHTTGRANMTLLEKLIYLADVIEPGRRPFPALTQIREAAYINLDLGLKMAAERTLQYLDHRGVLPDPNTMNMLKDYQHFRNEENSL